MNKMKGLKKHQNIAFSVLLFFCMAGSLKGQQSTTMYHMFGVPQSHTMNPAFQPRCGFYLGFPGISPLAVNFDNSALKLEEIVWYDNALDSLITFLHPKADINDFLNNFKHTSYFHNEVVTHIGSFGWRKEDWFYSVGIAQKASLKFGYPGDLMNFLLTGNEDGEVFDLSGFGFDATGYLEISLGMSKKINPDLSFGARAKYLLGEANISLAKTNATVDTHLKYWEVNAEFEGRLNIPFLEVPVVDNKFDFENREMDDDFAPADVINSVFRNPGIALDLGVEYQPMNNVYLSASIIDLGFIHWGGNPYKMEQSGSFLFEGVDVFYEDDSVSIGEAYLDTLNQKLTYTPSRDPYTTMLNSKVLLGGKYMPTEKIALGVLSRSEIIRGRIRQKLTLSANFYPIKAFSASFSYSMMNYTYNNFGFGSSVKLGPLNLYMISDLIPMPWQLATEQTTDLPIIPHKATAFNFRIGLNLIFGCRAARPKDLPLID
jgi:hypothetical protein